MSKTDASLELEPTLWEQLTLYELENAVRTTGAGTPPATYNRIILRVTEAILADPECIELRNWLSSLPVIPPSEIDPQTVNNLLTIERTRNFPLRCTVITLLGEYCKSDSGVLQRLREILDSCDLAKGYAALGLLKSGATVDIALAEAVSSVPSDRLKKDASSLGKEALTQLSECFGKILANDEQSDKSVILQTLEIVANEDVVVETLQNLPSGNHFGAIALAKRGDSSRLRALVESGCDELLCELSGIEFLGAAQYWETYLHSKNSRHVRDAVKAIGNLSLEESWLPRLMELINTAPTPHEIRAAIQNQNWAAFRIISKALTVKNLAIVALAKWSKVHDLSVFLDPIYRDLDSILDNRVYQVLQDTPCNPTLRKRLLDTNGLTYNELNLLKNWVPEEEFVDLLIDNLQTVAVRDSLDLLGDFAPIARSFPIIHQLEDVETISVLKLLESWVDIHEFASFVLRQLRDPTSVVVLRDVAIRSSIAREAEEVLVRWTAKDAYVKDLLECLESKNDEVRVAANGVLSKWGPCEISVGRLAAELALSEIVVDALIGLESNFSQLTDVVREEIVNAIVDNQPEQGLKAEYGKLLRNWVFNAARKQFTTSK